MAGVAGAVAMACGCFGGCAAASTAAPQRQATRTASARTAGASVVLTPRTVVIDRATVNRHLVGISTDGNTFQFKRPTGSLTTLKAGRVLILAGSAAAVVVKVSHRHGRLLVKTKPATVSDVIRSAHIQSTGKPDFKRAFLIRPESGALTPQKKSGARARTQFIAPYYPYVGRPGAGLARTAEGGFTVAGSKDPFGFKVTFLPSSQTKIGVSGTICSGRGGVCSNGPSNGLSAEVSFSGYVDLGKASEKLSVNGGSPTQFAMHLLNLKAHGKFSYTISRGQDQGGQADPPIIHLPVGVGFPVPGLAFLPVPLYFKLQLGLLLKLGFTSKNAVIRGGATVDTAGSESLADDHGTFSASGSGDTAQATIQPGNSISPAPAGTVMALQLPKIGIGLGVNGANGIGYVDNVDSMGQTTGSAIAGMFCANYDLYVSIGGGFEAQLGPLALATPKHLYLDNKHFQLTQPGCPRGHTAAFARLRF
jgi:hypothetical protein